jgi:hypothetical protein
VIGEHCTWFWRRRDYPQGQGTRPIRPGVVCSAKGAWLRTSDNGQTVSALAPSHYADLCEGACYNDAWVEVAPLYLSL